MRKENLRWVIGAAVLVVAALIGMPYVRWLQFRMAADKAVRDDLGRFPSAQQLVEFPKQLRTLAEDRGFDELEVSPRLQAVRMTREVTHWTWSAQLQADSHQLVLAQRVERNLSDEELELAAQAGIQIQR